MTGNGELKSILENMEHNSMVKLVMELEERTGNGTVADMARDIVILEDKQVKKVYPLDSAWRTASGVEQRLALKADILSSIQNES